jgi:hypothetical protein
MIKTRKKQNRSRRARGGSTSWSTWISKYLPRFLWSRKSQQSMVSPTRDMENKMLLKKEPKVLNDEEYERNYKSVSDKRELINEVLTETGWSEKFDITNLRRLVYLSTNECVNVLFSPTYHTILADLLLSKKKDPVDKHQSSKLFVLFHSKNEEYRNHKFRNHPGGLYPQYFALNALISEKIYPDDNFYFFPTFSKTFTLHADKDYKLEDNMLSTLDLNEIRRKYPEVHYTSDLEWFIPVTFETKKELKKVAESFRLQITQEMEEERSKKEGIVKQNSEKATITKGGREAYKKSNRKRNKKR